MLTETIRGYYAYADWANIRVLDQAAKLSDEQYFTRRIGMITGIPDGQKAAKRRSRGGF